MISFDPAKDQANTRKHGVSLSKAELIEWDEALTWQDDRRDYGEIRLVALAPIVFPAFSPKERMDSAIAVMYAR